MNNPSGRVVYVPTRHARMSQQKLQAALAVDDDNPMWRAVLQVIEEEFGAATLEASDPNLVPGRGTFPGGKIEVLGVLRQRLEDLRKPPKSK